MPFAPRGPSKTKAVDQLRIAKIAETRQRARSIKLQADEAEGKLVSLDAVMGYMATRASELRTILLELPANLSPRLNPADPPTAAEILDHGLRTSLNSFCDQIATYVPKTRIRTQGGNRPGAALKAR